MGLVEEGDSLSYGPLHDGVLHAPVELPPDGTGYWIPPEWRRRGLRYGTGEMVSFIVHAGRELARHDRRLRLSVADLSPRNGGRSRWHRSHQTGRDVDFLFLVRDAAGRPVPAEVMHRFDADGAIVGASSAAAPLRFDDAGNWQLVRSLLTSPIAEVQYVFISDDLKQRLLDHAIATGEPAALIQRAGEVLHQPSDSLPHDDHMHVRLFCARADVAYGCQDRGVMRWHKKGYKYPRRVERIGRELARHTAAGGRLPIGAVALLSL